MGRGGTLQRGEVLQGAARGHGADDGARREDDIPAENDTGEAAALAGVEAPLRAESHIQHEAEAAAGVGGRMRSGEREGARWRVCSTTAKKSRCDRTG